MGRTRTKKPNGSRVRLLDFDVPKYAEVIDLLSSQFVAEWDDGTYTRSFLFYKDKGVTWEDANDES